MDVPLSERARKAAAEALVDVRLDHHMGAASGYGAVPSGTLSAHALAAIPAGETLPISALLDELAVARRGLAHYATFGTTCPCGARPDHLDTHPHVIGCPVGLAGDS